MRVFVEAARRGKPGGSSLGGKLLRRAAHAHTGSPKQSGFFSSGALAEAGARGRSSEKLSSSASAKMGMPSVDN